MERFVQQARDYDKIKVNDDLTLTILTPPTIPPFIGGALQNQNLPMQGQG